MSGDNNNLLYVLSSRRETTWSKYKELYSNLVARLGPESTGLVDKIKHIRRRSLKSLIALGHCDVYFENGSGKIYSAPSLLARLPMLGFPKALLCGARGPNTVSEMQQVCRQHGCECSVEEQIPDQSTFFVPSRVVVESEDISAIASVALALDVRFFADPPAWLLATYAPTVSDYLQVLSWAPKQSLGWQRQDFDPFSLKFSHPQLNNPNSLCLSKYTDPVRGTNRYYLSNAERWAQVDVEWGRYAVLHSTSQNLLVYDANKYVLAVPPLAPLPSLLARSAALCTGHTTSVSFLRMPPSSNERKSSYEIYEGVPEPLAQEIAVKLGQRLVSTQIRVESQE